MDFDHNGIELLLLAKSAGVCFDRCAMLGRQAVFNVTPIDVKRLLNGFGLAIDPAESERLLREDASYSEPLLRFVGAKEICSINNSDY